VKNPRDTENAPFSGCSEQWFKLFVLEDLRTTRGSRNRRNVPQRDR
jgi:hypothetical protein